MPPDEPQYRQHYHPDPDAVSVRDVDAPEGMFGVRMPIASTGEVRNKGDDPLTREELDGMAQQLAERQIGVFPEHGGDTTVAGGRYSQLEKMGYWADPDVAERASDDGEDTLAATALMPEPETLSDATGAYKRALSVYKAQAERGIALSSSIGWREDETSPGGNDLMEASIVGIPADPRTDSEQGAQTEALARAAVDAGADPEAFVDAVRDVVMGPDETEGREAPDSVSDDTPESGDNPDTDDEQGGLDAEEYRSRSLDAQQRTNDLLERLLDAVDGRADDDGEDDDGEDEDDDDDEPGEDEDDDGENSADPDDGDERDADETLTVDGEELSAADIREMRDELRDADPEQPDDDDDTDDEQRETTTADSRDLLK